MRYGYSDPCGVEYVYFSDFLKKKLKDKNIGKEINRNIRYKAMVGFHSATIINCTNCNHTDLRMSFAKLPFRIFACLIK